MAEQLLAASIGAPGFMGVNTQDSSVSLEAGLPLKPLTVSLISLVVSVLVKAGHLSTPPMLT